MSKERIKIAQKSLRCIPNSKETVSRDFFTPEELVTCSCVPPKPGKTEHTRADMGKMDLLLGMYRHWFVCNFLHQDIIVFTHYTVCLSAGEVRGVYAGG